MCAVLEVSPSAYYDWEKEQKSAHERRDEALLTLVRQIFAASRARYGAPRVHQDSQRTAFA